MLTVRGTRRSVWCAGEQVWQGRGGSSRSSMGTCSGDGIERLGDAVMELGPPSRAEPRPCMSYANICSTPRQGATNKLAAKPPMRSADLTPRSRNDQTHMRYHDVAAGFITGPDPPPDQPLGDGATRLHQWVYGLEVAAAPRLGQGASNRDAEVIEEALGRDRGGDHRQADVRGGEIPGTSPGGRRRAAVPPASRCSSSPIIRGCRWSWSAGQRSTCRVAAARAERRRRDVLFDRCAIRPLGLVDPALQQIGWSESHERC